MRTLVLRLRELRQRAELSQTDLADQAGTSQRTVSTMELNKGRRVDLGILERIAQVLGVDPVELFTSEPTRRRR